MTYTSQMLSGEYGSLGAQVKAQVEQHGQQGWRLHSLIAMKTGGPLENAVLLVWEKS